MRFSGLEREFWFLGFFGPTSPPIRQPLADDAFRGLRHAFAVVDAKRHALVVAEIELAKVTLQVLLADVVIRASDPAL